MSFGSIIDDMVIDMNGTQLDTVAQLRAFLEGTLEVKFQPIRNNVERYGFITGVLVAVRGVGAGFIHGTRSSE